MDVTHRGQLGRCSSAKMMGVSIAILVSCAVGSDMSEMRTNCWHVKNDMLVIMFETSWPALEKLHHSIEEMTGQYLNATGRTSIEDMGVNDILMQ